MPHVIVKLFPGRTEEQKRRLAAAITEDVTGIADCEESVVSVAIEEVAPDQWMEKVYWREIAGRRETLYKVPSYGESDVG
jgi:4-oxalocrotonate tautomerase